MNNILASFIFFTRLPFWKIKEVPAECFKHVVPLLAFDGLADGRSHGRCAMAVRTDIARIHCLDYSCYCPPALSQAACTKTGWQTLWTGSAVALHVSVRLPL